MAKEFLTGNEAFAHAALEAGVRVCAGYPGTPSSEVIETVAKEHAAGRAEGVHVEWSTHEKAALELLAGAAYSGARTLYTCKQVGLNVASDALMSLNYVGVKGGTVLYVADDPGPISSQTEQDTRRLAAFAKVPVFDPATPEQGCQMMSAAYELSEKYQTPVLMRPTTRVCHASTYFEVAEHTQARTPEGFKRDSRWVIFPKRSYAAHKEINERLGSIANDFSESEFDAFNPMFTEGEDAQFGQPEINLGIMPGAGGTQRLLRAVGKSLAMQMVLSGEPISARRALEAGLVSEITPPELTIERALQIATTIANKAPLAVRLAKEALLKAQDLDLASGLRFERHAFTLLAGTADRNEGIRAFQEKRPARFNGQ